jgi:hypothetical protein
MLRPLGDCCPSDCSRDRYEGFEATVIRANITQTLMALKYSFLKFINPSGWNDFRRASFALWR